MSGLRRLTQVGSLGATILFAAAVSRAELMFEEHQGGPSEYTEAGNNHAADFQVTEAIRIQAITGWFDGGTGFFDYDYQTGEYNGDPGRVAVSISPTAFASPISIFTTSGPIDYFTTFHLVPVHIPPPGRWAGIGSLSWDLQPGAYSVNFFGGGMPLAYGYHGPLSNVSGFNAFYNSFHGTDTVSADDFPFGVRIYGRELSAIPEPSTYGIAASLVLLAALIASKRRPVSTSQRRLVS